MSRSGAQARLAQRRAQAGAEAEARSPKRKWPLRKIVGEQTVEIIPGHTTRHDLLECGHTVRPARDFIGETYPASRRCRECFRELTPPPSREGDR
jgi:hypothetical protein